ESGGQAEDGGHTEPPWCPLADVATGAVGQLLSTAMAAVECAAGKSYRPWSSIAQALWSLQSYLAHRSWSVWRTWMHRCRGQLRLGRYGSAHTGEWTSACRRFVSWLRLCRSRPRSRK